MTPERHARLRATLDRRQPDLSVIMDGVHKPHNIAAIVRTCDAVGILDVHAALPDNLARFPAGTALGSQRWVNIHYHEDGGDAIRRVRDQGMQVLAAHFSDRAVPYRELVRGRGRRAHPLRHGDLQPGHRQQQQRGLP